MTPATLPAAAWAATTFGTATLGDARRTARLVTTAEALAADPAASLPGQLADPAALKGAYRLLANDAVSFEAVLAPHREQTRQAATGGVVLLVQDTTTLDFTAHPTTTGLGPISAGDGQGLFLQTVLAVRPETRVPLGVAAAEAVVRTPAPDGETRADRAKRARESDIWGQLAAQVGAPPDATTWVHVADRGADCYGFFTTVQEHGTDLLVRVVQNRRVLLPDGTPDKLGDALRRVPPAVTRPLTVPAQGSRPARDTTVAVAWTPLTLVPPRPRGAGTPPHQPIPVWGVRVWEPAPPAEADPVEWLLLTTVPVVTVEDAWERVDWYTARWLIEELHKGLKTACRIEAVQLGECENIERLLAVLLPVAVRLLQLRAVSRAAPHAPVATVADAALVTLVARAARQPPADTVARFAAQVARLGGYQDRRGDGPPGWQTLWRGWQRLSLLAEGARLASV
jgi:hypothetical protein